MHIHGYYCLDCGSKVHPRGAEKGQPPTVNCQVGGSANACRSLSLVPFLLLAALPDEGRGTLMPGAAGRR